MHASEEHLPLGNLIEVLHIYTKHMEATLDGTRREDPGVEHLLQLLRSCAMYLTVYRDSVDSMVRLKSQLEYLKLKYAEDEAKVQ